MLTQIRPLTQEERQLARSAAEDAVMRDLGDRPDREHFNHHATHRYPPIVTKLISGLCIALHCSHPPQRNDRDLDYRVT